MVAPACPSLVTRPAHSFQFIRCLEDFCLGDVPDEFPNNLTSCSGFTRALSTVSPQWRCGPVTRPSLRLFPAPRRPSNRLPPWHRSQRGGHKAYKSPGRDPQPRVSGKEQFLRQHDAPRCVACTGVRLLPVNPRRYGVTGDSRSESAAAQNLSPLSRHPAGFETSRPTGAPASRVQKYRAISGPLLPRA